MKVFSAKIVTGYEKSIHHDNAKCKKSWFNQENSSTSLPKRKLMLRVWCDWKRVVHYKLLQPNEICSVQQIRSSDAIVGNGCGEYMSISQ